MRRLALWLAMLLCSADVLAQSIDYGRVGTTHWDGRYNFTSRPILEEGADRIWDLGVRVIKFELDVLKVKRDYDHNTEWRDYATARELVACVHGRDQSSVAVVGVTGSGTYHTLRQQDRCLTLDDGSYQNGARLSLRACDGGTAQQFWLQDRRSLRTRRPLLTQAALGRISKIADRPCSIASASAASAVGPSPVRECSVNTSFVAASDT